MEVWFRDYFPYISSQRPRSAPKKNGLKQYEGKDGFLHSIVTFVVNISWNLTLFRGQEYVRD